MTVIDVTDGTFEREVMDEPNPVLIDLYADWCGPCKQMAPIVAEIAKELSPRLKVVKIDIDKNPMCAQMFRASSVPMFVAMKGGKVIGHQLGAVPKAALLRLVEGVVGPDERSVDAEQLAALLVNRKAVAIDLRSPSAFGRFRIPGAINLPLDELPTRKDELRRSDGKTPVLYGRANEGAEVAAQLQSDGFDVRFLQEGFLAWEMADLEVERG
ncbi:MAG: thioredoxin domain-containing protein [Myxococcota bacterium]